MLSRFHLRPLSNRGDHGKKNTIILEYTIASYLNFFYSKVFWKIAEVISQELFQQYIILGFHDKNYYRVKSIQVHKSVWSIQGCYGIFGQCSTWSFLISVTSRHSFKLLNERFDSGLFIFL